MLASERSRAVWLFSDAGADTAHVCVAHIRSMQTLAELRAAVPSVMRSVAASQVFALAASCKHATLHNLHALLWPAGSVHGQHLYTFNYVLAFEQLAEHDMAPVQPRSLRDSDEELRHTHTHKLSCAL